MFGKIFRNETVDKEQSLQAALFLIFGASSMSLRLGQITPKQCYFLINELKSVAPSAESSDLALQISKMMTHLSESTTYMGYLQQESSFDGAEKKYKKQAIINLFCFISDNLQESDKRFNYIGYLHENLGLGDGTLAFRYLSDGQKKYNALQLPFDFNNSESHLIITQTLNNLEFREA